jgi:hypothetical protein
VNQAVVPLRFDYEAACAANDEWGFNCGPASIAAVTEFRLDELRPLLGDFERKRYTNPTLMWKILANLEVEFAVDFAPGCGVAREMWPTFGLARVQWEGPWTAPGVPIRARYRHTHWVGVDSRLSPRAIFDINAMESGGWVSEAIWIDVLVPWIIAHCAPRATGGWHLTHAVEIRR